MSPDLLTGLIGAGKNVLGNVLSTGTGLLDTWANTQIAAANIQFQKEENDITRQREDTAVQRKVADLQAAGYNPLLAVGSDGASSQSLTAPSMNFRSNAQEKLEMARQSARESAIASSQIRSLNTQNQNVSMDTEVKKAQEELYKAQLTEQNLKNMQEKIITDEMIKDPLWNKQTMDGSLGLFGNKVSIKRYGDTTNPRNPYVYDNATQSNVLTQAQVDEMLRQREERKDKRKAWFKKQVDKVKTYATRFEDTYKENKR